MIPDELMLEYGALKRTFKKEEIIFGEGARVRYYHQVVSGMVKMRHITQEGKEFIQGFFYQGQSFGEPPIFIDVNYPVDAVAVRDVTLWLLPKKNFMDLIRHHSDIHLNITKNLSKRIYYKSIMASEQVAKTKLLNLLQHLKSEAMDKNETQLYKIPLSRQQLSSLSGLAVETVIRTVKSLEKEGALIIKTGKIYV